MTIEAAPWPLGAVILGGTLFNHWQWLSFGLAPSPTANRKRLCSGSWFISFRLRGKKLALVSGYQEPPVPFRDEAKCFHHSCVGRPKHGQKHTPHGVGAW